MDETAFTWRRWRDRFKSDQRVLSDHRAADRAPDATIDEVGAPRENVGWTGRPLRAKAGNGPSTEGPASPNWPGWA